MNAQVTLDDEILQQAMRLTGLQTPQEVINRALCELIAPPKQDRLAQAFGQLHWEGDLDAMRSDTHVAG